MNQDFSLKTVAGDVLNSLIAAVADFVPRFLTGLVVVLIGWLLAKVADKAIRTAFEKLRLDELLEKAGLTGTMAKIGLRGSPGSLLGRAAYWLLLLLFVQSGAQAVGMTAIAGAIGAFFAYLPSILAALIVLMIGMMISQFVGGAVARSAGESGVDFAPVLGRAVSTLILFIVAVMAVAQLRIDTQLIKSVVLVVLGGFAVGLALSFGLGTRDATRNIVAGFYARKIFRAGDQIEMGGETGELLGVTALQTLLERDGRTIAMPNRIFLDEAVKQ